MKKTIRLLSLLLAAALLSGCLTIAASAATSVFQYGQTEARKMLSMVNNFRKPGNAWYWDQTNSNKVMPDNLQDLTYDYALEAIAMQRAAEIAVSFSHSRPDGTDCFSAYDGYGVFYSAAENIAMGTGYTMATAQAVFDAWCETNQPYAGQGHRRNMLSGSVVGIGIGHVIYNGAHYWVQEFGAPLSGAPRTAPLDGSKNVTIRYPSDPPATDPVTPDPPVSAFSPGDVDGNKKIEPADARLALRASVELERFAAGSPQFNAADVDGNGRIEPSDARMILRAAVGLQQLNGAPADPGSARLDILPDSVSLSKGSVAFIPIEASLPEGYDTFSYSITSAAIGAKWVGDLTGEDGTTLLILCVTALNGSGSGTLRVTVEGLPDCYDTVPINMTGTAPEDIGGFDGIPDLGARWRVPPADVSFTPDDHLFMLIYDAADVASATGFRTSQEVMADCFSVIEENGFTFERTVTENNPNGAGYADFHYYFNAEMNCELCIACYFIDGVAYEYFLTWQL